MSKGDKDRTDDFKAYKECPLWENLKKKKKKKETSILDDLMFIDKVLKEDG